MNPMTVTASSMNPHHDAWDVLQRIDLNVLVAFDVLMKERSVTRAAAQTGVTQSAMSHTLRRLRTLLRDPLFVRSGGTMVPTPRAEALYVPIRRGLLDLGRAVTAPAAFDPATSTRTFRFRAPDLLHALILPRLLGAWRMRAPAVQLVAGGLGAPLEGALHSGELDVVVAALTVGQPSPLPPELVQRTLFRDSYRLYLRTDHPVLAEGTPITVEAFAALDHMMVSPSGRGGAATDAALAEHGLERRIALRVASFLTAPGVLSATDLVLTAPTSLADLLSASPELTHVALPVAVPDHALTLCWHPRFTADAGHTWLRDELQTAVAPFVHLSGTSLR